jgi:hypothetical protein
VAGGVTAGTAGCGPKTAGPPLSPPPLLTWLGHFTRPAGATYPTLTDPRRFGSLSGLVHDMASNDWVAVVDDRDDSRVAFLSIAYGNGRVEVAPRRMVSLTAGPGVPDRIVRQADLEGIAALPDGTFVLSEEGHRRNGEIWQPALLRMTGAGLVTEVIPYPAEFQITEDGKTGLRDNQGFESVTRTPSGSLIAGLEQPLRQDGVTSFQRGGPGRLLEFVPSGSTFIPGRQWRYMLSPTPQLPGFSQICADGENGLVDLLALSDTRLIALERSCLLDESDRAANGVRLYQVDLEDREARKTLLLDLQEIAPRLPVEMGNLDNFEALALGPIVDNNRTLLVVSDDNFRKTQKTSFLLFGLRY